MRKAFNPARIRFGIDADRNGNVQMHIFGNTSVGADQPTRMRLYDNVGGRRQRRGHVDVDWKDNLVLVSVIDDRPVGNALRLRPQNRPSPKTRWQGP